MQKTWTFRLLIALIVVGAAFGTLAHPVMAGSNDPMLQDMPCCEPTVTAQDAAPAAVATVTSVELPTIWASSTPVTIACAASNAPRLSPLPKIPKQLQLTGCIIKRE